MTLSFLSALAARSRHAVLSVGVALAVLALPASAQVRISQFFGSTSATGTNPNTAYIELFNAGASSVDLSTYSVHYAAATGTTWTRLGLAGAVPARGYFLVRLQNPSTASTARPLPLPDQTSNTILPSSTVGKLALIQGSSTSAATGQCAVPPAGSVLVDFVGYGTTADAREAGGAPCAPAGTTANNAPAPSATLAIFRVGCGATDTNFNNADFVTGAGAPRNSKCVANGLSGAGSNLTAATGSTPTILVTASVCAGGTISGAATATIDLTAVGGAPTSMGVPVGNVFTLNTFMIPAATNPGLYTLPVTLVDGANTGTAVVVLDVTSTLAPLNNVCGANQAQFTIPALGGDGTSTVANATLDAGSTACAGTGVDTYFYFTPAFTGNWNIGICPSGTNWDSVITVHSACPATTVNAIAPVGSCPDGGCPNTTSLNLSNGTWALTGGTAYTIRVAAWSATNPAKSYTLKVTGQAPSNDTCAAAISLTLGGAAVNGSTSLASTDGTSSCDAGGRDVWYKVTTPGTGDLSISTCGSAIDTSIAVYATCGGAQIACNDDCGGAPCSGTSSCLTATGLPAGTYVIRVSDKGIGSGGAFQIASSWTGPTPPTGVGTVSPSSVPQGGSTTLFVTVTPGTNPTSTGIQVSADLTLIGLGSAVALFDDGIAPDVTANDNVFTRTVTVGAVADGVKTLPFTITDAQARSGSGNFTLQVGYCVPSSTTPCGGNEFISNTTLGTINNTSICGLGYEDFSAQSTTIGQGGSATINATVSLWFSATDTVTVFFDWNNDLILGGAGEVLTLTDPGSHIYTGTVNVPLTAAQGPHRMRVRLNFGANPGPCGTTSFGNIEDYTINVGPPAAPGNDICSGAFPATCGGSVTSDTTYATVDSAPTCGPVLSAPGVWYTITGTGFAMTATTCDPATTYDTRLTVFDGTCGTLNCVTDNDDDVTCTSPDRSTVSWASSAGATYYILVSGNGAAVGTAKLTLTCPNYCASTSTNIASTNESIKRVQIGSIDNTPAGTGQSSYVLYPLTTTIAKCVAEPITVTINNPFTADRCTVYVDWNHNLALNDAGEMFQLNGGGTHVAGVFTGTITPPYGALLGPTRMRVSMGDSSLGGYSNTNPCGTFTYGEVEDYSIDVATGGITFYEDVDGDGLGDPNGNTVVDCVPPSGYVANNGDGCPNDPFKGAPGQCGCGFSDVDSDGDFVADCIDGCPNDGNKTAPGVCGCGVSDVDSDGDLTPDCNDGCPNDANKTTPGVCGCGVSDVDSDGDLTPDCNDGCPNDGNKTSPGACGCGVSDVDSDGDLTPDCNDGCPNDGNKTAPGACGCGIADTDTDGDGTEDCNDLCPLDPLKIVPGACGCGIADTDTDADGVADCVDNCDTVANPGQEDCNANGIGDACDIVASFSLDTNANTVPDECEQGIGLTYCFGDGTQTACPCGNSGGPGEGCANSTGSGALLYNLGGVSVGAGDTALYAVRLPAHRFGLVYMGSSDAQSGGYGLPFGDGLRCVKGFTRRYGLQSSGATGSFQQLNPGSTFPTLILAGTTWYFQAWYRDPTGPCGTTENLSSAVKLDFLP